MRNKVKESVDRLSRRNKLKAIMSIVDRLTITDYSIDVIAKEAKRLGLCQEYEDMEYQVRDNPPTLVDEYRLKRPPLWKVILGLKPINRPEQADKDV
jgi:hypothetical protein